MAGGFGKRLLPFTEDLPKPMLHVDGRPLLERIVDRLRDSGIKQINVTTHYKSEKIVEHFGDGRDFGVDISYVNEDQPLGTGGALGLMPVPGRHDPRHQWRRAHPSRLPHHAYVSPPAQSGHDGGRHPI